MLSENGGPGEKRVSTAEGGLVIGMAFVLAIASGIGDGVALEENGVSFLQGNLRRRGMSGGGGQESGTGGESGGADEVVTVE
ncbi:MAG: hypothetical protein ACON38_09105 [Akkermansiaceae bacterium]